MNAGINLIETTLQVIWRASWQASVLAGIVLVLQWVFRRQISARGRYLLWAVVLVRLLIPVLPESRMSMFNWHPFERNRIQSGGIPMTLSRADGTKIQGTMYPAEPANPDSSNPPPPRRTSLWQMVTIAWSAGVMMLFVRVGWTCARLSRLMRSMSPPQNPQLIAVIDSSAAALGIRWRPRVLCGDAIRRPALVGAWSPTLLLPTRVLEQCDPAEIRLIILHELAHLKRRDVAANWLITAATLVHWFNPIVWLVAARMRADRELACDEMVLADSGGREARAYAQTLLKLVEILAPAAAETGQLVGILESFGPMQRRVLMIAKFDPRHSSRWMWALAILLLLAVTALTDAVSESASAAAPATAPAQAEAVTDQAVRAMLEKRLPEVQFDGNSFNDVIEFLRDVTQTNLLVDWPVLKAAGIDKEETKISLHLRNVTFGKALELILHEAGGKKALLAYMIKNGGIVITTREKILQDNPPLMTDEALQQLLNKPLPEIKFDDNPFNDVIEFLRDVTQANLLVDWKVLNDFGIDKETKISLQQLRGVTLGQALDHILRGVGGNAVSLGYMIKSGAIVITTQEKIAQERTPDQSQRSPGPARRTVYYDVRDLIESGDAQANLKELVSVVSSTPILTDRGTEASIGDGATYNVQGFGTKLIITTTEEGHKHVADLLAHLREKPTTRPR